MSLFAYPVVSGMIHITPTHFAPTGWGRHGIRTALCGLVIEVDDNTTFAFMLERLSAEQLASEHVCQACAEKDTSQ